MAQPVHFKATVTDVINHDVNIRSYALYSDKRLPRFLPGQFIHLSLDNYDPSGFWPESRVFSVANFVSDNHTIKLLIGRQGYYTNRILDELQQGSIVSCKGPYGDFTIKDDIVSGRKIILIAGGTGITAFSGFFENLMQQEAACFSLCHLLYGVKNDNLLVYKSLTDTCLHRHPGFKVTYFAENRNNGSLSSDIVNGRINIKPICEDISFSSDTLFYLSGPKMMIDHFTDELKNKYSLDAKNIMIDAW